jgi:urease accessory protein UreF
LQVKRLDFWNIENELTPNELAVHWACESVEPTGEARADMRAAWMTAQIIAAQSLKPLNQDDVQKLLTSLQQYLPVHRRLGIETSRNLEQSIDEVIP